MISERGSKVIVEIVAPTSALTFVNVWIVTAILTKFLLHPGEMLEAPFLCSEAIERG
jgi:hypothetical protein